MPIYYESLWASGRVIHNETGGWDYIDNYEPYRYRLNTDTDYIVDDIYLPWVSNNWYGWNSTLYARNNGTDARTYVLQHTLYRHNGNDAGAINTRTYLRRVPFANDLWELPTSSLSPGDHYRGGGVVAADAGTSAVVLLQGNGKSLAYNGIFPFDSLGQATATTLYMPVFLYTQNGNALVSKVFLQNAGSAPANITITYYGDDGRICTQTRNNLNPWATVILDVPACNWAGTPPASGAVRLWATQPIAAMTLERLYGNRTAGYNAFSQGATTLYLPELLRNAWGVWNSTLHLMNVGNNRALVTVNYYTYAGTLICADSLTLGSNRHLAIDYAGTGTCMAGRGYDLFSAVVTSAQPLVAVVNEDNATHRDFQAYNAAIVGKASPVLPLIRNGLYGGENWRASITVQNTVNTGNRVTLTFYDQDGEPVGQPESVTLASRGAHLFYADPSRLFRFGRDRDAVPRRCPGGPFQRHPGRWGDEVRRVGEKGLL